MEADDLKLIQKLVGENPELEELMEQHEDLEQKIDKLNQKPALSPSEQTERKRLQKLKLAGRDRIEEILSEHRPSGT